MPWHLRLAAYALTGLILMAALPGCGEAKVKITGKLLKDGQPYTVAPDTLVTLVFAPDMENAPQTYPAKFNQETGGYEVEMPPGKYRARYIIVEIDQAPLTAPPEVTEKSYDLSRTQQLDIEIASK